MLVEHQPTVNTEFIQYRNGLEGFQGIEGYEGRSKFSPKRQRPRDVADFISGSVPLSQRRLKHISTWELVCLTCFNFPYGLICGTMGLLILPAEAQRLYPSTQSVILGVSLGIVGLTQLVCPIAGKLSDLREASEPLYQRGPYIGIGTAASGLSVLAMWITSKAMLGWLYYLSLFVGMAALNVIYSVQCGLVPDFISDDLQGKASGVVAVNTIVGSGTGFVLMMATNQIDFHFVYPVYFILLVLSAIVSLSATLHLQSRAVSEILTPLVSSQDCDTPETRTPVSEAETSHEIEFVSHSLTTARPQEEVSWKVLIDCYTIDVSQGYDFFWVFLGRTFYYVAVSCQAFMLFYLRDVVGTADPGRRDVQIGTIALCAQGMAAAVAYPMGRLSDSDSMKKKPLVYAACCMMATTYTGFMFAPLLGGYSFWFVVAVAIIYGVGNGCFLAVDYALALATLPSKDNNAQAMGIWGVSAFIGSAIGPLVWGLLIRLLGSSSTLPPGEYLYTGYLAMLAGGVVVTILAGWILTLIEKDI